jgi:hypothetical protein
MSEVESQEQHNQFIAEVGPVLTMSRVPNIEYGHERYFDFMSQFYLHTHKNLELLRWGNEGQVSEGMTQVLLRMGDPNSGKTFIENSTRRAFLPRLDNLPYLQGKAYDRFVLRRSWEEHGEEAARTKGLILTPRDESYERPELHHAENELIDSIAEAISVRQSAAVEVELPAGIEATIGRETRNYRPLGARVVRQLVKRQGVFSNLKYEVWAMVSIGGPYLGAFGIARERVRRAKSLGEAETYARRFGMIKKDAKLTEEYWESLKNGAYMKQMPEIDKAIAELMEDIWETPEIVDARQIAEQYKYDDLTQPFVSKSGGVDHTHPWIQGARWQQFLANSNSVGLDSSRAFIGFYNPTPLQLGMTREDVVLIQEELRHAA